MEFLGKEIRHDILEIIDNGYDVNGNYEKILKKMLKVNYSSVFHMDSSESGLVKLLRRWSLFEDVELRDKLLNVLICWWDFGEEEKLFSEFVDDGEYTVFDYAIMTGDISVVREFLVWRPPKIAKYLAHPYQTLLLSVRVASVDIVRILLDNGANPNSFVCSFYGSILSAAITYSKTPSDVALLLLERGANPNIYDGFTESEALYSGGISPLVDACAKGLVDVVDMMIAKGVNVNVMTRNCGDDIFGCALFSIVKHSDDREKALALLSLLVQKGSADVNIRSIETGKEYLTVPYMFRKYDMDYALRWLEEFGYMKFSEEFILESAEAEDVKWAKCKDFFKKKRMGGEMEHRVHKIIKI